MAWHRTDRPQSDQNTLLAQTYIFLLQIGLRLSHHGMEGFCSQVMVVEKVISGQTHCSTYTETPLIHSSGERFFYWIGVGQG